LIELIRVQSHLATDRAIAEAASGPGKQTAVNKKKCLYIALLKALKALVLVER
jgi:hypothetical protein